MKAPPENQDAKSAAWIAKELNIPHGSREHIKAVIRETRRCAKLGIQYTGKKKHSKRTMIAAIPLDSPAAKIIADAMESGASIRQAHAEVEDWLRRQHESGEENVKWWGLSATYSCYLRMKPTFTVVQKRAQGSDDPDSAWCKACLGWVTQLLVRTQQEIPEEWGGPLTPEELEQPCFQVEKLTTFSPHRVVEWDETHPDLVMDARRIR